MKKVLTVSLASMLLLAIALPVNAFWWDKEEQRTSAEVYTDAQGAKQLVERQFTESINAALCIEFKALKDKIGDDVAVAHSEGNTERMLELTATQAEVEANIIKACTQKSISFNLVFDDPEQAQASRQSLEEEIAAKQAQLEGLGK